MGSFQTIDVLGVGNAIVDVISAGTDESLTMLGLEKGAMRLVDESQSEALYAAMGPALEVSGGSVCNSLAALCSLGGSAGLIAKVADDTLGRFFTHDMRASGVRFDAPVLREGPATGRCLIQVTPDGERTMATYLGASVELDQDDVEDCADLFGAARLVFFDGYLLDRARTRSAVAASVRLAREAGRPIATSLGDVRCVERNHAAFLELIQDVSLLFANENEMRALAGPEGTVSDWLSRIARPGLTAVVTRGADGSSVLHDGVVQDFPAARPERLVDTTGAGDSFAAGYTYGWIRGWSPAESARLGALVAARIIAQTGARAQRPLSDLAREVSEAMVTA